MHFVWSLITSVIWLTKLHPGYKVILLMNKYVVTILFINGIYKIRVSYNPFKKLSAS